MNTRSKSIASNTTADMNVSSNTLHIPDDPTQEELMPPWARIMVESMQATSVNLQATNANLQALIDENDQHDHENENLESLEEPMPSWAREMLEKMQTMNLRLDGLENTLNNLESPDESDSWEDSSPQIEIPEEPINEHLNFSNFVPSNDYYLRDMTDNQYNEVKVDIPMIKEVDDPKEYLNEDMISSLPKTIQCINPTPRSNRIIRCYKCKKVGHVKANCSKMIIVMDDSNPLPTDDSKNIELEDEVHELDKTISFKHVHIIHDIVLKEFASSYKRYKTFIAFPRRYKILKQSDLVDTKIHPPKLLKISFKFHL